MAMNVQALRKRALDSEALRRYAEVAQILTGRLTATAGDGVTWVQELSQALHIPGLATYGLAPEDFPSIIEKTAVASSTQGNPVKLTPAELHEVLKRAL
jgi:alcohol dehydrogenase class IV